MGNLFGHYGSNGINLYLHPEIQPSPTDDPTFDPNIGFPNGRKQRHTLATEEEFKSAKIPLKHRDYCGHELLKYYKCKRDNFPWVVNCTHEKHTYLNCQYDDFVLRMKEYEREKRLRIREQKLRHAEAA